MTQEPKWGIRSPAILRLISQVLVRPRRSAAIGIFVLLLVEAFASTAGIAHLHLGGVPLDMAVSNFQLTKLAAPLLPAGKIRAIEASTKTTFVGLNPYVWDWARPDTLVGERFLPRVSLAARLANHPGVTWFATDDHGFVLASEQPGLLSLAHPDRTLRIVLLGTSTAVGTGSSSPSASIGGRLLSKMTALASQGEIPGVDAVELINASNASLTAGTEFIFLASELVHYSPDLVILFDGPGDFASENARLYANWNGVVQKSLLSTHLVDNSAKLAALGDPVATFGLALAGLAGRIDHFAAHTGVGYWIEVVQLGLSGAIERLRAAGRAALVAQFGGLLVNSGYEDPYYAVANEVYRTNLDRIVALGKNEHFRVMLTIQPFLGADGKPPAPGVEAEYVRTHDVVLAPFRKFYSSARAMFAERSAEHDPGACWNDTSRAFQHTEEEVYDDYAHLLDRGTDIIATLMVQGLRDCGFLAGQ